MEDIKTVFVEYLFTKDLVAFGLTNKQNSTLISNENKIWNDKWELIKDRFTDFEQRIIQRRYHPKHYVLNVTGAWSDIGLRSKTATLFLQAIHSDFWYDGLYLTYCFICGDITEVISLKKLGQRFKNDVKRNLTLHCKHCLYRCNRWCVDCFRAEYASKAGLLRGDNWRCRWCHSKNRFEEADIRYITDFYLQNK